MTWKVMMASTLTMIVLTTLKKMTRARQGMRVGFLKMPRSRAKEARMRRITAAVTMLVMLGHHLAGK
jgi:hypothetical protein